MRIWHKSLIPALPREQLAAQWRECSAIAGNILKLGHPNHILVNKIMDYPLTHFISYSIMIRDEMTKRGYKTMNSVMEKIESLLPFEKLEFIDEKTLFADWHNINYLRQCYYNLEEKYDCGGIKEEDMQKISAACVFCQDLLADIEEVQEVEE